MLASQNDKVDPFEKSQLCDFRVVSHSWSVEVVNYWTSDVLQCWAHLRTARRRGFSSSSSSFESSSSSPWKGRSQHQSEMNIFSISHLAYIIHQEAFSPAFAHGHRKAGGQTSLFWGSLSKIQLCNLRKTGIKISFWFGKQWNNWGKVFIKIYKEYTWNKEWIKSWADWVSNTLTYGICGNLG